MILPVRKEHMVMDEKKYIKKSRRMLYCLGFYYIVLGFLLLFINGWPAWISIAAGTVPLLLLLIILSKLKKYEK